MSTLPYSAVIFDLDDTLLDTTRYLVEPALEEACTAMLASGLTGKLEECKMHFRQAQKEGHSDLFAQTVRRAGVSLGAEPQSVQAAGEKAFYGRTIKEKIDLMPGARELLEDLAQDHRLFLVTAGVESTQQQKVTQLKVDHLFEDIFYISILRDERKQHAFQKILHKTQLPAQSHLSVGNRLDQEIVDANNLGMRSCWLRYGEYRNLQSQGIRADFTIDQISEVLKICRPS